jgi:hypothetical protein
MKLLGLRSTQEIYVDLGCQSTLVVVLLCTEADMVRVVGHRLTDTCYQSRTTVAEVVVELHS